MNTKDPETPETLTGLHYGIAGAATGTFTRFLVQPLDVLKIRFQLETTPRTQRDKAKYRSIFQAVHKIVKEEGPYGLWKGHIPAQFLSIVFGAVQFSTYEYLSKYFHHNYPGNFIGYEHILSITCGCVGGLAATVASFPFDVIKTHLVFQSEPKVYSGMVDVTRKIYRREGPKGFSKGLTAACIQTAPMSGLVFCFHGIFTKFWLLFVQDKSSSNQLVISTTGSITTGLLAGLCAKTIVYPFDLMKKRLQIQGFHKEHPHTKDIFACKKISECFILTVKNEGFLGLFKGLVPTLVKSGATTSLYFTTYEKMCQFLQYSLAKR